ncbi:hypothetical protein BV25DRAFT_1810813 [Artomyces pyxidatus]|uniref:Uncharacterized protein n=1 Tax=Artomyces pyxidatus TaxID=48021 RepID=A0ACB8SPD6_9AGAM|nr:hypothetical protein BV25DRAFT_1810813 [Artomyces pyxidatus]
MPLLTVDNTGTQLFYLDSGVPYETTGAYTTVFAVHGLGFSSPIFNKIIALAPAANLRFVAINRRGYKRSTPISAAEAETIINGTDEDKSEYLKTRGLELSRFIDIFIRENNTPPISPDGKTGGIAILGWSAGNGVVLSAIANVDSIPEDARSRLGSHLRALIMQEPPSVILGMPSPTGTWSPHMDTSLAEQQTPMYTQWITSYFRHGDLAKRDTNVLSYIVPATFRRPTIYNMSPEEIEGTVDESMSEVPSMISLFVQAHANYRKACFDRKIRELLPRMKVSALCGDATCSFPLAAFWALQDDDKAEGGGFVNFRMILGVNHFMQWDDPDVSLKAYTDALL